MFDDLRPHLVELRKRLGYSVLSFIIMFIFAFSFHEPILAWVTQPLNDALSQVNREIKSKEDGKWEVEQLDQNTTEVKDLLQEELNPAQTYSAQASEAAKKLQNSLELASQEAASQKEQKLSSLLKDAAEASKEVSQSTAQLTALLADEETQTEHKGVQITQGGEGIVTTHQIGGVFFVALKVSFFAALFGALPFILYQIWLFIAPGLYSNEKKMILPFVIGGSVMFFIGVFFAYYVVTPFGFQFLITFGAFLFTPLINIEDYVGFFAKIMLGFGLAFELPVFSYFLALLGLIDDRMMRDFFKYAVVIIFIVAALLTPPDVLTQLLMAGPLIILYGLSILIVRLVNPAPPEEDEDENESEATEEVDVAGEIAPK